MSNFNNIRKRLFNLGYSFIDENIETVYKDVNEKYNIIDNYGYKYFCCLKHIFANKFPNFVGTTNPYSIENIRLWIKYTDKDYTLLSTNFNNSHSYLDLRCNICNCEFNRTWNNLKNGNGCRKCRYNNQKDLQMKPRKKSTKPLSYYTDICLDWSNKNERPYTDYSSGSGIKVWWECHECKYEWKTTISHRVKDKSGCPKCANKMSKAEKYIYDYLTNKNIFFNKEYIFFDCKDINPLPFDFYIPSYNMCIEYDGLQHFKPVKFSKEMTDKIAQNNLIKTQKHDKIKNEYCANNKIKLVRISYNENLETRLNEIFKSVA